MTTGQAGDPHDGRAAVSPGPGGRTPSTDVTAVPVGRRTVAALVVTGAAGLVAFCWPLLMSPESGLAHATDAPLVLAALVAGVLLVAHLALVEDGLDVKAVALLGLLSAVGAVARPLSAGAAGVELVFIVLVLGGRVLGPGFGFVLGSTTLLVSALLTGGVGPWLPFQMLAASWFGLGAGLLPRRPRGATEVAMLAGYGAVAAVLYGIAMNLSFWPFQVGAGTALSFVAGDPVAANLRRLVLFSAATSLGWDLGRAVTTAVGVAVVGGALLTVLRRATNRATFGPQ